MNAVAVPKSRRTNLVEGMTLTAVFTAFPTFAGAALLLNLSGTDQIVGSIGGATFFVVVTSILTAITAAYLGPKYPRYFKGSYEPVFFDATLSFREKFQRWLAQPKTAQQLVTLVLMLSVLAVAVASVR